MAKDEEVLINEKGSRRPLERFFLGVIIVAGLGLIIGLIAYLASSPPRDSSDYVINEPKYPTSGKYTIDNGEKWLMDKQKTAMGWMDNQNADAMLALRLGMMSKYHPGQCDFNTLSKSLEYDILSALMRNNMLEELPWVRFLLPKYIVALRAACIDATDFHGKNLIMILENHFVKYTQYFNNTRASAAMLVLAKCVSESMPTNDNLAALKLDVSSFASVSEASLVLMALTCLNQTQHSGAMTNAENYLMREFNNSHFGDTYATGLAVQALSKSNRTEVENAVSKAVLFLATEIQTKRMGQFMNIGEASNVLPALTMMSWADVKGKCSNLRVASAETGPKTVNVTIEVNGTSVFPNLTQTFSPVTINEGQSLLTALETLQRTSTFRFMSSMTSYGSILYSVMGNQVAIGSTERWGVYLSGNPHLQNMYLDKIIPADGSKYILKAEVP